MPSLDCWLEANGLADFKGQLTELGVTELADLQFVTGPDLAAAGIPVIKARRLLAAIPALQGAQAETATSVQPNNIPVEVRGAGSTTERALADVIGDLRAKIAAGEILDQTETLQLARYAISQEKPALVTKLWNSGKLTPSGELESLMLAIPALQGALVDVISSSTTTKDQANMLVEVHGARSTPEHSPAEQPARIVEARIVEQRFIPPQTPPPPPPQLLGSWSTESAAEACFCRRINSTGYSWWRSWNSEFDCNGFCC